MKIISWIVLGIFIILILGTVSFVGFLPPTKAEVERFFVEDSCDSQGIGKDRCTYYLRRQSTLIGGQVFSVPMYSSLFIYTPFHYYTEICMDINDFYTYTWIDTKEGRFVYNAVNGKYIKEINSAVDPQEKWFEDAKEELEEKKAKQSESNS